MGTVRISETNSSPATTFQLEADLLSQSVAGNYSTIRCYISAKNGPGGTTGSGYGGAGYQAGTIVGVKEFARRQASSNFLPTGYRDGDTRWRLGPYDVQVPHNSDGTRAPIKFGMVLDYGNISETLFSAEMSLPTIARASRPTMPANITLGTAVTIDTKRASSSFTHTLQLWEYGVDATAPISTIATDVGASYTWTPPLNLAEYFPAATSKQFFLRTITHSGTSDVGRADTVFTLNAPASMVPSVSGITVVDDNPAVVAAIGAFVQGQSILKATVAASGIYGSTIESSAFSIDGTTAASGGTAPLPLSGTRVVSAAVVDSRGRSGAGTRNISVLAYDLPKVNEFSVERATYQGVVSPNGLNLKMTLKASASSLVVGTQKNSLKITVKTRERGTTSWTTRNVIDTGISYNSTVMITAAADIFHANKAWEVAVEVKDKLQTSVDYFTVSTVGAIMDSNATQVAINKMVETAGPTVQLGGDTRVYGDFAFDGTLSGGSVPFARIPDAPLVISGDVDASVPPSGFPLGVSVRTAGTGFPANLGTVLNVRHSDYRQFQHFYDRTNNTRMWIRAANGPDAWQAWREVMTDASPGVPFASARGTVPYSQSIAHGSGVTLTATFPAGRFTQPPNVTATPLGSARLSIAILEVTTTSANIRLDNFSGNNATGAMGVFWQAEQATATSGNG